MQIQIDSRTLDVATVSGTVLQVGKRDRVTIHSTGGSVGPHGGPVAPPRVYSSSTPVTEVWIRDDAGREMRCVFHIDLSVREGHVVTIANTPNAALVLANHSTGDWQLLNHLSYVASAESLSGNVSFWISNQLIKFWVFAALAGAVIDPVVEHNKQVESREMARSILERAGLAKDYEFSGGADAPEDLWASAMSGAFIGALVGGILAAVLAAIVESINRRAHRRMGARLQGPVRQAAEDILRIGPAST